ncbi:NAD(P)-binding protein [Fusarium pseudocircinatum]|uniref:NAD(P)-binding protein n=1 Tax=Fusarium pseudocircinatum TaxID=56676 RepID=A0A8H5KLQ7_9HYPO|nr:NAD(P)-binding protein [Fusarium pseudocircinatum]
MASLTYLVTGANRGIGKGLVASFLSEPRSVVIAAVRDLEHETSQSLLQLPRGTDSKLIRVNIDAGDSQSIHNAFEHLIGDHGIRTLDVVVANAGKGGASRKLHETPLFEMQEYMNINAYGIVELFKSSLPLLVKAAKPTFCAITSAIGSNNNLDTSLPLACYTTSKLVANHFLTDIYSSVVNTEMTKATLQEIKKLNPDIDMNLFKPISVEESAQGLKSVIVESSHEKAHGRFLGHDGTIIPW